MSACHFIDFCLTWLMVCRERKNVNLPGVIVDLPTLTKKDEEDLVQWGLPNDIDFIAASFVRKGSDITNIRKVCLDTTCKCKLPASCTVCGKLSVRS